MDYREIGIDESFEYFRHEFHYEPEKVEGNLLSFVYDVPYFGACGVFPPLHIANQWFISGGADGGMSPGATWEPFQLKKKTFSELLDLVKKTDPKTLKDKARYISIKFIRDKSFDPITDQFEWLEAVCNKHRERFHAEMAKGQSGV
jgi:hypothetical protein